MTDKFTSVTFQEGVDFMLEQIAAHADGQKHSIRVFSFLDVIYCGDPTKGGEYNLQFCENVLTYRETCQFIVNSIQTEVLSTDDVIWIIGEIAADGLQDKPSDSGQIKYLKSVLYWTTLKEELRYYNDNGAARRRLLQVYSAAALTTRPGSQLNLEDVKRQADELNNAQR